MSSVLIRNGLVIDGTGRAAFPADVLVEGDRIAGKKGDLQLMYFVNGVIDEVLADGRYAEWIKTYQVYWNRISQEENP